MIWPPLDLSGASHASQITLRHRIPKRSFTAAEASSYLIESFYPARPLDSHVLVLSPQVELSPLYYHYLIYSLLELRYSRSSDIDYLMGISLDLPTNFLNGSADFTPPSLEPRQNIPMPFLWEAPNCNAALYFGERWMELHSFFANRVSTMKSSTPKYKKQVTESYPAWMEYLLELMRARGYSIFYPNHQSASSNAFATVHSELYQSPEEYTKKSTKSENDEIPPPIDPTNSFETDLSSHPKTKPHASEPPLLASSLLSLLPKPEDVPSLSALPHISYDGSPSTATDRSTRAADYAATFRREIGKCVFENGKIVSQPVFVERSADDLFCNLDDLGEDLPEPSNFIPSSTGYQATVNPDADVYNPDAIPADNSAQIQDEFAAHLKRQSGKTDPETKDTSSSVLDPFGDDSTNNPSEDYDLKVEEDKEDIIPGDEWSEAKAEFGKHLARQSEQGNAKANLEAQVPSPKKGRIKGSDEKEEEASTAEKTVENPKGSVDARPDGKRGSDVRTIPGADTEQRNPGW